MLRTRPVHAPAIRAAAALLATATGLPELDVVVLADIATRQPVTRAELAKYFVRRIRGRGLRAALAHDVIAGVSCSPTPGGSQTLVTTEAFFAMFGIRSLEELGEAEGGTHASFSPLPNRMLVLNLIKDGRFALWRGLGRGSKPLFLLGMASFGNQEIVFMCSNVWTGDAVDFSGAVSERRILNTTIGSEVQA